MHSIKIFADTFGSADAVLQAANCNPKTKILVVGYSPTGGGHTGRLLNIIDFALIKRVFLPGSVIIFHVPPMWENVPRRAELDTLCRKLLLNGVAVILAESTKPVYGYLDNNTGGSNDARILERLACYPLRNRAAELRNSKVNALAQLLVYDRKTDINNLPAIESNVLFSRLQEILSRNTLYNRLYVLTDMDFALQKSAARIGVPPQHRLDQQNHAILLETSQPEMNILPKYALLAKVLGGTGELISHIALGEKNTLGSMVDTADKLQIKINTPVWLAQEKILKEIEKYALSEDVAAGKLQTCIKSNKIFIGVICSGNSIRDYSKKNIVYIYAHKKTNVIAQHILTRLSQKHQSYSDRIFVFCGSEAVGGLNALHLAYLADADGIATAGAGTCGEFSYLHRQISCQARLLVLPIEGHNEQEANLVHLSTSEATKKYIYSLQAQENLQQAVDRYLARPPVDIDREKTMADYCRAIANQETYSAQAFDLLFGKRPLSHQSALLRKLQTDMHQSPLLKGTRRYLKMIFQAMLLVEKGQQAVVNIWFSDKEINSHKFDNLWELGMVIGNDALLANVLDLQIEETAGLPLRPQVSSFFKQAGRQWSGIMLADMDNIKKQLGEFMVTGF